MTKKLVIRIESSRFEPVEISQLMQEGEEHVVQTFSSTRSSTQIPKASITLKVTEKFSQIIRIGNGDRFFVSGGEADQVPHLMFVGEVVANNINSQRDSPAEISLLCLSPFHRLQLLRPDSRSVHDCDGFRALLDRLLNLGGIWGRFEVGEEVADSLKVSVAQGVSAYALLNTIAIQRELILMIDIGDVMLIRGKAAFMEDLNKRLRVIDQDQVLSFKYSNP